MYVKEKTKATKVREDEHCVAREKKNKIKGHSAFDFKRRHFKHV